MIHAVSSSSNNVVAATPEPESPVIPQIQLPLIWEQRWEYIQKHFHKWVAGILVVQGLWALYQSVNFILVEFPLLEQQLLQHTIDQQAVNRLANKATLEIISTIISMIFALRITIVQSRIAQKISTVIGILLVVGNSQLYTLLNQIGSEQLLTTSLVNFFKRVFDFSRNIETTIEQEIPVELKN